MIELKNVTKIYGKKKNQFTALKNISLTIPTGASVAILGKSGSGKSTLMHAISGLDRPQHGQVIIDGQDILQLKPKHVDEFRAKKIGFIPETPSLYEELTLREHIETVAMAYDIEQETAFERVDKLLEMFRLKEKLDWFPVHFSKGMKQKVMIICAFVVDPSLFIVDEPFLGLDPVAIADLIQLLDEEKKKGKSILMSTHVLDSAEKMCDSFVILHKGQVRAKGSLTELRAQFQMPDASLNDIYLALTEEAAL